MLKGLLVNGRTPNGLKKFKVFYHKLLTDRSFAFEYGARETLKNGMRLQ
jgi:hypothetical protein